jgi:hypothetical protein
MLRPRRQAVGDPPGGGQEMEAAKRFLRPGEDVPCRSTLQWGACRSTLLWGVGAQGCRRPGAVVTKNMPSQCTNQLYGIYPPCLAIRLAGQCRRASHGHVLYI